MENLEPKSFEDYVDALEKLEKEEKEHAKWLAGLSEVDAKKYFVEHERFNKFVAIGNVIDSLIPKNYINRDLLTLKLLETLWHLGDICVDWFPSKSVDALLEELFKPVFNNLIPELRPEKSSEIHNFLALLI